MRYRVTYNAVQTVEIEARDARTARDMAIMKLDDMAWRMRPDCLVEIQEDGKWKVWTVTDA